MQTFSPSPRHRETASSTPPPQKPNAQPIRISTCKHRSKSSKHPQTKPSPTKPGHTSPHQQSAPRTPLFRPNATRAIEQDGLGGSPYLVSKIIPQREGFLFFSALTPQGRRPRVGQPGRDEGLVPQSFRRGQKASPHEVRSEAFCMPEDDWGTKPSSLPGICSESEYPCCYSALPTELRLVMRILTSSVISRMPSLAGFLGSKQAGFSAM